MIAEHDRSAAIPEVDHAGESESFTVATALARIRRLWRSDRYSIQEATKCCF